MTWSSLWETLFCLHNASWSRKWVSANWHCKRSTACRQSVLLGVCCMQHDLMTCMCNHAAWNFIWRQICPQPYNSDLANNKHAGTLDVVMKILGLKTIHPSEAKCSSTAVYCPWLWNVAVKLTKQRDLTCSMNYLGVMLCICFAHLYVCEPDNLTCSMSCCHQCWSVACIIIRTFDTEMIIAQ